jgi:glycosyltransferase involved in cell wall biosynthesis
VKTIVISAVNLTKGGTLTILRECLRYLSEWSKTSDYRIVALVHRKDLACFPNIEYIEMQWPKKNWFNRLWCEYVTMKKISVKLSPVYLWLSLHDTTPNVFAEKRAVYCHNPFPFHKWKMREWMFTPRIVLLSLFSKYIYRRNIHKNTYVVVQQDWMRKAFVRLFGLQKETVIVAPPSSMNKKPDDFLMNGTSVERNYSFLFASYPDSHKNFEVVCQAAEILKEQLRIEDFKVYITIKEEDNAYTQWLFHKWGKIPNVAFIGFLDRKSLYEYYNTCHCLVFPSKVETWGLPITEFAAFNKPMLLADLPYTHETAGGCTKVAFFNPDDPYELADKMRRLIQGDDSFLLTAKKVVTSPPVAKSWRELFNILLA